MRKKNNLSLKTTLALGVIISIIMIATAIYLGVSKGNDNELSDIDRISKILTTTRKTDIFIKGEKINFNDKVSTKQIDKITMSEINEKNDYTVIIINDLDDNIQLLEDEIALLKGLICKNNYMLIYLGEKYSTTWDDTSYGIANVKGNLCYIYYSWDGIPTRNIGAWNISDQETIQEYPLLLGETLLYSIEEYLQ